MAARVSAMCRDSLCDHSSAELHMDDLGTGHREGLHLSAAHIEGSGLSHARVWNIQDVFTRGISPSRVAITADVHQYSPTAQ